MTEQQFTTASDPSDFTVDQVKDYLATLDGDDAEVQRVLEAERTGKARVSLLEAIEGTPEGDGTTPGLETKAATFQEAAEQALEASGEAYEKGYFGYVPSKDGDHPEDLSVAGVIKAADQAKADRQNQDA